MSGKAKVRGVRVYTRLSAQLRDRISSYCAASRIAERSVFEAALQQYVDGTDDLALVLRRLDRLGRANARLHRDVELLSEAFAVFVRLWFAHTPTIPADGKAAARSTAESRYRTFVEHVGQQFSDGRRFLDDLPRETIANDAELDAIAALGQQPRCSAAKTLTGLRERSSAASAARASCSVQRGRLNSEAGGGCIGVDRRRARLARQPTSIRRSRRAYFPSLIQDWSYTPTVQGAVVKASLAR